MALATLPALEHVAQTTTPQGPVLIATDGNPASDAALCLAAHLESHTTAAMTLVSVVEPVVMMPYEFGMSLPYAEIEQAQRDARTGMVQSQLERLGLHNAGWQVTIEYGDPAIRIADMARDAGASLIIMGLGKHDLFDRIAGSETALGTLRMSRVPVLAVSGAVKALPRTAVIATDFSVASLDAARAALRLFPDLSEIHLVHVMSRLEVPPNVMVTWDGLYTEPVAESFERMTTMLDLPESVSVRTATREGKASREIVQYARSVGADLIVTGSRGAGFISRLLVGSTASGIIRGADRAVLAVPAAPGSERFVGELIEGVDDDETRWSRLLAEFTNRNTGRRTLLEVDDPDFGQQIQEHGYPLLGVAYDHNDRRVAIMLGDMEGTQRHLSRGIAGVTSIDVLRDAAGRDRVLRVAHGRGQTLLTFQT